ncbi:hypothetical protein VIGAN_01289900, partial [Vigna angularis var. angularis]
MEVNEVSCQSVKPFYLITSGRKLYYKSQQEKDNLMWLFFLRLFYFMQLLDMKCVWVQKQMNFEKIKFISIFYFL